VSSTRTGITRTHRATGLDTDREGGEGGSRPEWDEPKPAVGHEPETPNSELTQPRRDRGDEVVDARQQFTELATKVGAASSQ
jgi:hypothetical protein